MSHTVRGLPTDPTTKKSQLGTIGRGGGGGGGGRGGDCARSLALAHDVERWSAETQPGKTTEGTC